MRDAELTRYYSDEFRRIAFARFVVTGLRVLAIVSVAGGVIVGIIVAAASESDLTASSRIVGSLFWMLGGLFWAVVLLALSAGVDLLAALHEARLLGGDGPNDDNTSD